jgi:hypothetical protein
VSVVWTIDKMRKAWRWRRPILSPDCRHRLLRFITWPEMRTFTCNVRGSPSPTSRAWPVRVLPLLPPRPPFVLPPGVPVRGARRFHAEPARATGGRALIAPAGPPFFRYRGAPLAASCEGLRLNQRSLLVLGGSNECRKSEVISAAADHDRRHQPSRLFLVVSNSPALLRPLPHCAVEVAQRNMDVSGQSPRSLQSALGNSLARVSPKTNEPSRYS